MPERACDTLACADWIVASALSRAASALAARVSEPKPDALSREAAFGVDLGSGELRACPGQLRLGLGQARPRGRQCRLGLGQRGQAGARRDFAKDGTRLDEGAGAARVGR